MSLESMQRGNDNYTVSMEVVTVDWSLAQSDSASVERLRLLIDFGEHARELISAEVGLRLLELLADKEKLVFQLTHEFSADVAHQVTELLQCCVTVKVRLNVDMVYCLGCAAKPVSQTLSCAHADPAAGACP
jgi:hypothetical protein